MYFGSDFASSADSLPSALVILPRRPVQWLPSLALPVDLLSYETSQCAHSRPHCNGALLWHVLPIDLQSSTCTYCDSCTSSIHIRVSYWLRLLTCIHLQLFHLDSAWHCCDWRVCRGLELVLRGRSIECGISDIRSWLIDCRHSMRTRLHRLYVIINSS